MADGDADVARLLESTLEYLPWIEFETHPVMTIEDAFPVIESVYG